MVSVRKSADFAGEAKGLRIGERLSQIRKAKGLTLARLSEMTAISEATLSRAETAFRL